MIIQEYTRLREDSVLMLSCIEYTVNNDDGDIQSTSTDFEDDSMEVMIDHLHLLIKES